MVTMLPSVLIVLAIILIILVLLQRANTDASGAFSSDGGTGALLEKRGAEKMLHRATALVGVFFVCLSLLHLFIH